MFSEFLKELKDLLLNLWSDKYTNKELNLKLDFYFSETVAVVKALYLVFLKVVKMMMVKVAAESKYSVIQKNL